MGISGKNNLAYLNRDNPSADMVLRNGRIITVDPCFSMAESVAIKDGVFIAVGSDQEVKPFQGPETKVIDLKQKTVTPGIIDSHAHPVGVGRNLRADIQTSDIDGLNDLIGRLSAAQESIGPDEWIITAANWYVGQIERRPNLSELDAATPCNPLWLPLGVYEGFTNSIGLKKAGITGLTLDPPGGIIYRDQKTGKPTGHLRGAAMKMITGLLPPAALSSDLRTAVSFFNSIGVTSICSEGLDYYFPGALEAYRLLRHSGQFNMRCVLALGVKEDQDAGYISGMIHALTGSGLPGGGLGDDRLRVIGLKLVNENTVTGETLWPKERLREVLLEAARCKLSVRIHGICAAVEEIVDLYREVDRRHPIADLRWAIVHMHMQTEKTLQAAKELGLVVNHDLGFSFIGVGPTIWYGNLHGAPGNPGRMIAPVSRYLESGIPFSLNSDAGGANNQLSIWTSVFVACNRENWPGWGDEYNIGREEALRAVTMEGAYRLGMEDRIGSIERGKLADLAVLSHNPLTCEPEKISGIKSELTILEGRIVHQAD